MTEVAEQVIKTEIEQVQATPKKHIGAKAFVSTFGASLFIQACTVLQGILIARLLGPVGRGEFAAIILWPTMFSGIGIFGSNIAIARASAKGCDLPEIKRISILLGIVTSSLSSLLCLMLLPVLIPQAQMHIISIAKIYIIFIPLNHISLNLVAVDQGIGNFKNFNFTRSVLYPVYLSIIIGLWMFELSNVRAFVFALITAQFIAFLIRLHLAVRGLQVFGRIKSFFNIVKESVRFGLAGMAQPIYLQADKALMLSIFGPKELGFYCVGLSASAVINSITVSIGMVAFSVSAQADQGDGFAKIARSFRISVIFWVILGVIMAAVMPFLLPVVYGSDFSAAINPARFLLIGSAFAGFANLLEQSVRGQGKAFVGLEGRVAGLVAMVIISMLLKKTGGMVTICIAYSIAQCICFSVVMFRVNQHYRVKQFCRHYLPSPADIQFLLDKLCDVLNCRKKS